MTGAAEFLRQSDQREVGGKLEFSSAVIARSIEDDGGVCALGHGFADLREMQVEGVRIGVRQHQGSAGPARRTGCAEDVSPVISPVARGARPRALLRPDAGQRALLANAGFILEPDLDRLALGARR